MCKYVCYFKVEKDTLPGGNPRSQLENNLLLRGKDVAGVCPAENDFPSERLGRHSTRCNEEQVEPEKGVGGQEEVETTKGEDMSKAGRTNSYPGDGLIKYWFLVQFLLLCRGE